MTDPDLTLARRATRWAVLTPQQQRQRIQIAAWHLQAHCEAKRHCQRHPAAEPPAGRQSFGALDNIPSPEWEAKTL